MTNFNQLSARNKLLQRMAPALFAELAPHLKPIELPIEHVVVEPNAPTELVIFIERGLGSVIARSLDGEVVEVGHIGFEGMTGSHLILGIDQTPNKTFMQIAGAGLAMPAKTFISQLKSDPCMQEFFLRYVHAIEIQVSQSALANARYNMHERLARWLLMCADRIEGSHLPLTHDFLGIMLGVRRSGVTNQLHILEGLHAIRSTRGSVEILDREKLEEIADGSYGLPEKEYERLLKPVDAL